MFSFVVLTIELGKNGELKCFVVWKVTLPSAQVGKNTLVVTIFTFMLEQQLTCLKQLNN